MNILMCVCVRGRLIITPYPESGVGGAVKRFHQHIRNANQFLNVVFNQCVYDYEHEFTVIQMQKKMHFPTVNIRTNSF